MPNYTIAVDPNWDMAVSFNGRNLAIDASGRIWAVYARRVAGTGRIYAAYSNNNGVTWTEEDVSVDAISHDVPTIAIDSTGIIHVTYNTAGRAPWPASWGVFYKQRSVAGIWSAEETISLEDTGPFSPGSSIAIDSADDVHCIISTKGHGTFPAAWNIIYRKRTAGVWGAVVQITDINDVQGLSAIAIDSFDVVHLSWQGKGWGVDPLAPSIMYCSSPLWVPEVVHNGAVWNNSLGSIAVDSVSRPYIAWIDRSNIGAINTMAYYSMKTAGVWSARERVDQAIWPDVDNYNVGVAVDKIDDLHFVYSGLDILYRRKVSGVWSAQVNITSDPVDNQLYPVILWATWPRIAGIRTNVLLNQQCFIWKSEGVAVMFGYVYHAPPPTFLINRAFALSREEL